MTLDFRLIPCTSITIDRDDRQRREIDTSDLIDSIRDRGVLVPIILDDNLRLIAGERRLTTCLQLGIESIPARLLSDLSPTEAKIIELTENLKRKNLSWQDNTRAIASLHEIFAAQSPSWSRASTARELSIDTAIMSKIMTVAPHLDDPKVAKLDTFSAAFNLVDRKEERKIADALTELGDVTKEMFAESGDAPQEEISLDDIGDETPAIPTPTKPTSALSQTLGILPADQSLINADFISWADEYSGPSFNFIHCDFPYGVNLFAGKQSGRETHFSYDDESKAYWLLLNALMRNLDKLLGHSGHIMFWFSMDYYTETMALFAERAPSLVMNKRPLIWHKTDNVGIISDPQRGPRNIYEVALFGSREDRPIVKPVSNVYGGPTDRKLHPSTKPEAMLRHFFSMFVDENTVMLDPTAGSASSLRAAESLGAKTVFGLERDQEIHRVAKTALQDFRLLRRVAR